MLDREKKMNQNMFWKKIKTQQQLESAPSHVSYLMFPRSPVLAWKGSRRSCRQSHSSYFWPEECLVRVLESSPHRSILIVWHAPLLNFSYWLDVAADWTDVIHHRIFFEFHAGAEDKEQIKLKWTQPLPSFTFSLFLISWFSQTPVISLIDYLLWM